MRRGSITAEDQDFVETWENIATRQNAIVRLDARGEERQEVISGRRSFMITTEERLITENKVLEKKDNPFKNGDFRPVIVPDSVTIETNPNALSDEEIRKVLNSSEFAWGEWMQVIDSPATFQRMMDLAEAEDITLKRYKDLERRFNEVRPQKRIQSNDPLVQNFLDPKPGGLGVNTAASGTANPRRQGGMSSDYR